MSDLLGRTLGPYQVVEQLGAGGMATVYKAYQPAMDRYVALKVLPQHMAREASFRERFSREARTIARLEHRNILPVYDVQEVEDVPFLVMRYTTGGTLGDLIGHGPVPFGRAVRLVEQVGEALGYAHGAGVIHRDIKPANILLDRDGTPLLTDFGIAKIVEGSSQLTADGALIGTPFYMAPEQARGQPADARTDIYALGVVLYELVTGRRPYLAETPLAVALMHVHDPLPLPRQLNPAIPEPLERVLLRALAKRPEDRFQSAGAMVEALREVEPLLDAATPPPAPTPPAATVVLPESLPEARPPRPARRWPWAAGIGALALVAVLAGVAAMLRPAPTPGATAATAPAETPGAAPATAPAAASGEATAPPAVVAAGPTVVPPAGLTVFGSTVQSNALVAVGDTVWLATEGGLVRYGPDGQRRVFTSADGLPFNRMAVLTAAPDGSLWMAAYGRAAYVRPVADGLGEVTAYADGLDIGNIQSLLVDPTDGSVWAGGDSELRRFDGSSWARPALPLDDPAVADMGGSFVTLLRAADGALWMGRSGAGLLRWDGTSWARFGEDEGVPPVERYQLFQSADGALWAAAAEAGLLRFDPDAGRWSQAVAPPEGGFVVAVGQLRDGSIGLSSSSGLRYSADGGASWETVDVPDGYLGSGQVAQTSDGRIWVGGASSFADGSWTKLNVRGELPFTSAHRIVPAPDGKLWVTEQYGGAVAVVDPAALTVERHPLEARIYAVTFSDDTTWFGTSDGVVRLRNGARTSITADDGLPSNSARSVLATQSELWIGTDAGLARYDMASEAVTAVPEFDGGIVDTLLQAPDGSIWAGSLREDVLGFGLLGRYDGTSWTFWRKGDLPNTEDAVEVTRLRADTEGRIWVLTWSSGLYRWDGSGWQTWRAEDGAPQATLLGVAERGDEVLIGGDMGPTLFRLTEDGWSTLPVTGLSGVVLDIYPAEDGALWLATSDGLLRLQPE